MSPAGTDPLANLRPLHLPSPVSWFPPAPGWWLLMLLSVILVGYIIFLYRKGRLQRAALAELKLIEKQRMPLVDSVRAVNALLKSYLLQLDGTDKVASLSGTSWLQYLDRYSDGREFLHGPGQVLRDGPYRSNLECDIGGLFALVHRFIKTSGKGKRR